MYPPTWGLGNAPPFPYGTNGPFGSGNFISGPGQALPSNHPGAGIGQSGFLGGAQLPGSSNFGVAGQPATGPGGYMPGGSGGFATGGRAMGGGQGCGAAPSPPLPGSLCGGRSCLGGGGGGGGGGRGGGGMGGLGGIPGQGGPRQGGRGKGDGGGFLGGSKGGGGGRGKKGGKDGGGRGRGGKGGGDGGKNNVGGCGGGCGGCMPFCGGKAGGCKPPGPPPPLGGKGGVGSMMGRGPGGLGSGGHSNLFVGNLPEEATEEMVREAFSQCGTVTSCRVLTRSGRTCALVKMENVQQAEQACKSIPNLVGGDMKSRWLVKIAETDFGSNRGKDGFGKGCKGFDFFKGKGKPFWGFGFFKGKGMMKGQGKGKGPQQALRVDPALKVWIGNLPENAEWKELQTHMNQAGKTVWVEVFSGTGKGTGAVVYSSAEEVTKAIEELNGQEFGGQNLVVDAWVRQVREPAAEGEDGAPTEEAGKEL